MAASLSRVERAVSVSSTLQAPHSEQSSGAGSPAAPLARTRSGQLRPRDRWDHTHPAPRPAAHQAACTTAVSNTANGFDGGAGMAEAPTAGGRCPPPHRRTNLPPIFLAYSQLNRAVRAPPTCSMPVGEGANRTLICRGGWGRRGRPVPTYPPAPPRVQIRQLRHRRCSGSLCGALRGLEDWHTRTAGQRR